MTFTAFFIVAFAVAGATILLDLAFVRARRLATGPRVCCVFAKLAYVVTVVGAAGLALTGFGAVTGAGMHGWALIFHCTAAPVFAVGLAGVALAVADDCRFAAPDASSYTTFEKVVFWLAMLGGVAVIGSAVLGLLKFAGTECLRQLMEVHRYSAAATAALLLVHFYRMLAGGGAKKSSPVEELAKSSVW